MSAIVESRKATIELLNDRVLPLVEKILRDSVSGHIVWNNEEVEALFDWVEGPFMEKMLFGPDVPGPYCKICKGRHFESRTPASYADHAFSTRGRGEGNCYCLHPEEAHVRGSRGTDSPFYMRFEAFNRARSSGALDKPELRALMFAMVLAFRDSFDAGLEYFEVKHEVQK
jgi:hypothetical protein